MSEVQLAEGWTIRPLGTLLESMESGSRPRGGVRGIVDGVPSLGGEHLDSHGGFNLSAIRYVPRSFFDGMRRGHIRQGDVLIVKDGATTGKVSLVGKEFPFKEAVANEHLFVCRPREVAADYLFWFLFSDEGQRRVLEHFKGSAQGGITRDFADGTLVPIAPQQVQRSIARLLNATDLKRASATSRLSDTRKTINHLRKAILGAACSGRLTTAWRESHRGFEGEDVVIASLVERAKVRKLATKVPSSPDSATLGDLPESWSVASIDQLCPIVTDGEHQTPDRTASGVPLLSARNVLNGEIVFEPIDHVSEETYQKISKRIEIQPGDVLLTCSGSVGRSAVVDRGMRFALVRSVAVLRPVVMNAEFLSLALRSPWLQDQIENTKTQTAQANIFQGKIRTLTVPVPPLKEQARIVELVAHLMDVTSRIEQRIDVAEREVDRGSRAVVAKAFRGQLLGSNGDK